VKKCNGYLRCYSKPFVGESFWDKETFLQNPLEVTYCDCFQTFVERKNFFGRDTDKLSAKILPEVPNIRNVHKNLPLK
jgi:hypothetical protein